MSIVFEKDRKKNKKYSLDCARNAYLIAEAVLKQKGIDYDAFMDILRDKYPVEVIDGCMAWHFINYYEGFVFCLTSDITSTGQACNIHYFGGDASNELYKTNAFMFKGNRFIEDVIRHILGFEFNEPRKP